MIDSQNQLFQLRIGSEGQISLSHQIMAIPSSINLASIASVPKKVLEAGIEAPKRVLEAGIEARDKMKNKATRRWRKAVTGDPEKRIRDHMKEVPQVKMIDKLSFTFGVLCICGSEWISLRHADWFPVYYSIIMTLLLLWRLVTYTQDKYQLFMLGKIWEIMNHSSPLSHTHLFRFLLLCKPLRVFTNHIFHGKYSLV